MPGPSPEGQGHVVVERKGPQTDVCVSGRHCEGHIRQGGTGTLTQLRSLPILPGPQIQSPHDPSSSTVPRQCPWGTVLWEGGLPYGVAGSHTPLHGPAAAALLVPSTACPLLPSEPPRREERDLSPDSGVEGCPRGPVIHLALGFLRQPSPHTCDVVAVSGPTWLLGGPGSESLWGQPQPKPARHTTWPLKPSRWPVDSRHPPRQPDGRVPRQSLCHPTAHAPAGGSSLRESVTPKPS